MSIAIGIDAGGTYTDVVVYSTSERTILGSAKALTTKEDLAVGINEALDHFDGELLRQATSLSLSTTLATNACVENKGGNGRLVFIGVNRKAVEWVGGSYGLPPTEDMRLLSEAEAQEPGDFLAENEAWLRGADGIAVVDLDAERNSAALEKRLMQAITEHCGVPVICGHELSSELNSLRRGASTLLNVRLIPVIAEFLEAIRSSMGARGIEAPVSIMRSDGTLMSESFTKVRPVETLLCGPSAGLVGVAHMTTEADCIVIDMGGTTTDISIIRDHRPQRAVDRIQIGQWRTSVNGMFVDTFGLGGDSTIRLSSEGRPVLEARRGVPLCMLADRYPQVREKLLALVNRVEKHTLPLHEFFVLGKDIEGHDRYTDREKQFCRGLRGGPMIFTDAAALLSVDIYNLNPVTDRLEREGVVLRGGLTPTDMMHIKGDYDRFDTEASRLGARLFAASFGLTEEELPEVVYGLVKEKLHHNIIRVLLQWQYPQLRGSDLTPELTLMIEQSWRLAHTGEDPGLLKMLFQTPACLVGIGAPIHIFLPDVAKALCATWSIPENAGVANAFGAAVSRVEAVYRVEVHMNQSDGLATYDVNGPYGSFRSEELEPTIENAMEQAKRAACDEARRRGITGELWADATVTHNTCVTGYGSELYLGSTVEATAYCRELQSVLQTH